MRKEFIVERQGKSFCLYAGLLELAHQQGLKSIQTELIQIPTDANNMVAICSATVILEQDGKERIFTGIGDAAPKNVAPAMQACLLRMSETRAKARALRDAVNIGVAAVEELGDEDGQYNTTQRDNTPGGSRRIERPQPAPTRNNIPVSRETSMNTGTTPMQSPRSELIHSVTVPATDAQMEAIRKICRVQSLDPDAAAREQFEIDALNKLTNSQASQMIKQLNSRQSARPHAAVH